MANATWGGQEWQSFANDLLFAHFGHGVYVRIPDAVRGDAGLEGYTTTGHAYQCYAPQHWHDEKDRCDKLKAKINEDLNKLSANHEAIHSIISNTMLSVWFLLTPDVRDKDLIAYAHTKAAEVRNLKLAFISPNFDVQLIDADAFPVARQKLLATAGRIPITIDGLDTPDPDVIDAWGSANGAEWDQITAKLAVLASLSDDDKTVLRRTFATWWMRGEELMSSLQTSFQEQHQSVIQCRHQLETRVSTASALSTDLPERRLETLMTMCQVELRARIPGLPPEVITELTHAMTAYWMVRCPLKFRGTPA